MASTTRIARDLLGLGCVTMFGQRAAVCPEGRVRPSSEEIKASQEKNNWARGSWDCLKNRWKTGVAGQSKQQSLSKSLILLASGKHLFWKDVLQITWTEGLSFVYYLLHDGVKAS